MIRNVLRYFKNQSCLKASPIHEYRLSIINRCLKGLDQYVYPIDDFRHYRALWSGIPGWLTRKQAHWLFDQAKKIPKAKGDIVEIGSAWGRSTVCLGWGVRLSSQGKVYAVDPHYGGKGFQEKLGDEKEAFSSLEGFLRNIKRFGLEDHIIPIVATSEEALKEWRGAGVRLLFVDGWHTYSAVRNDVLGWAKYVVSGGIIALHDYSTSEEVRRAVHDSMNVLELDETSLMHVDGNMVYFRLP